MQYDRRVITVCHLGALAALLWGDGVHVQSVIASAETPNPPHTLRRLELSSTWTIERPRSAGSPVIRVAEAAPVERPDGFDQAIVSWNIAPSPNDAVGIELRVGPVPGAAGEAGADSWSPWLSMGEVRGEGADRAGAFPTARVTRFVLRSGQVAGKVDVDYFVSQSLFSRAQVRVFVINRADAPDTAPVETPRVAGLWICMTDSARVKSHDVQLPAAEHPAQAITIAVPFRSQRTPDPSLAGRLCSPTSVAMVLAYRGVDRTVLDVAMRGYDDMHDVFGNWPRCVQAAFSLGVPGYVTRFNSWDEVARTLQAGTPIIASVTSYAGELRNAPYSATGPGHLIVITGLDAQGGVLVNDPAGSDSGAGQRTYRAEDLTSVWLRRKQGTAYVLEKP